MDEKQFFDKARQVAKAIDQGEYKVCSLEEAEAFAEKRKASAYKPVAWMNIHGQFNKKETWLFPIPLYTHPVKTLTDEEIWELAQPYGDLPWQDCTLEFARAILRKAQEK